MTETTRKSYLSNREIVSAIGINPKVGYIVRVVNPFIEIQRDDLSGKTRYIYSEYVYVAPSEGTISAVGKLENFARNVFGAIPNYAYSSYHSHLLDNLEASSPEKTYSEKQNIDGFLSTTGMKAVDLHELTLNQLLLLYAQIKKPEFRSRLVVVVCGSKELAQQKAQKMKEAIQRSGMPRVRRM